MPEKREIKELTITVCLTSRKLSSAAPLFVLSIFVPERDREIVCVCVCVCVMMHYKLHALRH